MDGESGEQKDGLMTFSDDIVAVSAPIVKHGTVMQM